MGLKASLQPAISAKNASYYIKRAKKWKKGEGRAKIFCLKVCPKQAKSFHRGETGAYAVPRDVMQELTASHTVSLLCQHKRVKTREISAKSGEMARRLHVAGWPEDFSCTCEAARNGLGVLITQLILKRIKSLPRTIPHNFGKFRNQTQPKFRRIARQKAAFSS